MKQHIFLASPHMSDEGYEKEFVKEAFDTNWIALSAGTAAIHMALKSIGVEKCDGI